ncbi:hypothetical protein [Chromobacterium violaceum]|uniref:Lipoprotein n=1 Tax=Chromobacterium violaceum TaxID=536 RepID=A0AAX2MB43_CHRVL|nr:hypothetical protein [Chromobacterium violaceum]MBP4050239.1 hypothetical protein [Chromobacterium violaceum]STB71070.1 Uncharacterised protein [Chromobacterium violaceum]SUX33208.1 Uncharacterised protein [Chromobacterium violaceum]
MKTMIVGVMRLTPLFAACGLSACVVAPPRAPAAYRPVMTVQVEAPRSWRPAEHPYYLHAMSDLRQARAYLARPDYPQIADDERRAVAEIDAALGEMQRAAIEDGKDPWRYEQPDARMSPTDRFHRAMELLDAARRDAGHQEDDPWVRDLQRRILRHIDAAHRAVQQAVNDALR